MKICIVTVAYNRPDCLLRLLDSLKRADYPEPVPLIISVDKSDTDSVEHLADEFVWPYGEKIVARHAENMGLRAHMLSLGRYFEEYDALVVLEDDTYVSSSFYHYVKACVECDYADPLVAGISLYAFRQNYQTGLPFSPAPSAYDVYLMQCAQSWGEVWMKDSWQRFSSWYETHSDDFSLPHLPDALNSWPHTSWLKYHTRYCIEQGRYFVYPYFSHSTNNADRGSNSAASDTCHQAPLMTFPKTEYRLPDVAQCPVRYDGFFEPMFLADALGLPESELTVSLLGELKQTHRRYLLTRHTLPYKVLRSFAMELRPVEMNVLTNRSGFDIFLYDTCQSGPSPASPDPYRLYHYLFPNAFFKARTMIGFRRMCSLQLQLVWKKICSVVR